MNSIQWATRAMAVLVTAVVTFASLVTAAHAQVSSPGCNPLSSIRSVGAPDGAGNTHVVDIPHFSRAGGSTAEVFPYKGGNNQRWCFVQVSGSSDPVLYRVINVNSGLCLDADGATGSYPNGTRVQQWSCHGGLNQQWQTERFRPWSRTFRLRNRTTDRCLDITAFGTAPRTKLQLWDCHANGWNQKWYFYTG